MIVKIDIYEQLKQKCVAYGISKTTNLTKEQLELKRKIVVLIAQYSDALKLLGKYRRNEKCAIQALCRGKMRDIEKRASEIKRELTQMGVRNLTEKVRRFREANRPSYLR